MNTFSKVLTDLEQALNVGLERTLLMQSLAPGISVPEIRRLLESTALDSSPEIETLYSWHNGTIMPPDEPMDDRQIFPGYYFMSLEEALERYRAIASHASWNAGWVPVLANGGGDFYVIDQTAQFAVRHFQVDEQEHPVEYNSLADLFRTERVALDERVIYVDSNGYLEMDDLRYMSVAAKANPGVTWWQG